MQPCVGAQVLKWLFFSPPGMPARRAIYFAYVFLYFYNILMVDIDYWTDLANFSWISRDK